MRDIEVLVAVRTAGAPVVATTREMWANVFGPIRSLGLKMQELNASDPVDAELLALIPNMRYPGPVLIVGFHMLPDKVQNDFAQYMKLAADESDPRMKVIALGDETTPTKLIGFAHDLCLRLRVLY